MSRRTTWDLAALLLSIVGLTAAAAGDIDGAAKPVPTTNNPRAAPTTVSVYLPDYHEWTALRGSILSTDQSVTAYTIFCADQAPTCEVAGDIPFIISEGPRTLHYGGSAAGIITADLRCDLAGTTEAICTGSSSLGPNYRQGTLTGPTQTVWKRTFSGTDVSWGVLTLATPVPGAGTTDIDGTAAASKGSAAQTATSGASRQSETIRGRRSFLAIAAASMAAAAAAAAAVLPW